MMRLWWLSVEKALVPALWSRKQNSNGPTGPSEIMRKAQKRYEHRPGSDECWGVARGSRLPRYFCWPRRTESARPLERAGESTEDGSTGACKAERHRGRYNGPMNYNRLLTGRRHHREGVPQVIKKENQKKPDAEKEAKGEVVRMKAMESIGQTKKWKAERESQATKKRVRRSTDPVIGFIEASAEASAALHQLSRFWWKI